MPWLSDRVKGVRYRRGMRAALLVMVGIVGVAHADVVDSAAGGFTVKETATVDAPAAQVWSALFDVGKWWDKDHTYSHDSANLTLEPLAGGCFCEQLPDSGGAVEHARVVNMAPYKLLRMRGALGPLQDMAVDAVMSIELAEASGKTTVTLTYKVGGYAPKGLADLAKPVDAVLAGQLKRLKAYAPSAAKNAKSTGELKGNPFDSHH